MTCTEALDLVEGVAAGDVPLGGALAAHIAGCAGCAAALETASQIERTLIAMPVPAVPTRFVQGVVDAVRRERWRYEQRIDRAFNLTITAGITLVIVALVSLLNAGSVARLFMVVIDTVSELAQQPTAWPGSVSAARGTVSLTVLIAAAGMGVWWWAERRDNYDSTESGQA